MLLLQQGETLCSHCQFLSLCLPFVFCTLRVERIQQTLPAAIPELHARAHDMFCVLALTCTEHLSYMCCALNPSCPEQFVLKLPKQRAGVK